MLINILIFLKKQDLKPVIWQILRDLHFHRNHSIPDLKCNYITKRLSITNWQNGVTFTWLMYYIMLVVCKKNFYWVCLGIGSGSKNFSTHVSSPIRHCLVFILSFIKGGLDAPHLLYIWACFPLVGKVKKLCYI